MSIRLHMVTSGACQMVQQFNPRLVHSDVATLQSLKSPLVD